VTMVDAGVVVACALRADVVDDAMPSSQHTEGVIRTRPERSAGLR
jgi:hypothetical protein